MVLMARTWDFEKFKLYSKKTKTARPKYNNHHDKKDSSTAECIALQSVSTLEIMK